MPCRIVSKQTNQVLPISGDMEAEARRGTENRRLSPVRRARKPLLRSAEIRSGELPESQRILRRCQNWSSIASLNWTFAHLFRLLFHGLHCDIRQKRTKGQENKKKGFTSEKRKDCLFMAEKNEMRSPPKWKHWKRRNWMKLIGIRRWRPENEKPFAVWYRFGRAQEWRNARSLSSWSGQAAKLTSSW